MHIVVSSWLVAHICIVKVPYCTIEIVAMATCDEVDIHVKANFCRKMVGLPRLATFCGLDF